MSIGPALESTRTPEVPSRSSSAAALKSRSPTEVEKFDAAAASTCAPPPTAFRSIVTASTCTSVAVGFPTLIVRSPAPVPTLIVPVPAAEPTQLKFQKYR
jgi:hypothetical protein